VRGEDLIEGRLGVAEKRHGFFLGAFGKCSSRTGAMGTGPHVPDGHRSVEGRGWAADRGGRSGTG
jgi:hypothetical protein